MTVNVPDTANVRDQYSAYEDPRFKEQPTYHEFAEGFDAWLEEIKAEAEAKGRAKAFSEVYETLEGQVDFLGKLVEEDEKNGTVGYINSSFIDGIRHSKGAIESARHLAELPEALTGAAFFLPSTEKN